LDDWTPKRKTQPAKIWIKDMKLYKFDREVLLSPTGWITDGIVNAAQSLLKKQFPAVPGLQSVSLGLVMSFDIQEGEFIQILHTGNNHWLTISTIGMKHPQVKVYDSVYDYLEKITEAQIATLLCTREETIEVHMMDVQIQVSES
jgi:hypothetical protein